MQTNKNETFWKYSIEPFTQKKVRRVLPKIGDFSSAILRNAYQSWGVLVKFGEHCGEHCSTLGSIPQNWRVFSNTILSNFEKHSSTLVNTIQIWKVITIELWNSVNRLKNSNSDKILSQKSIRIDILNKVENFLR